LFCGGENMTKKNSHIGFRISAKHVGILKQICKNRGEDLSDFARRTILTEMANLSFLKPLEKKALGVKVGIISQTKRRQEKVKKNA
jgi:hypothetical protein